MKKLIKLKCPNCNADLSFKEERENYFCEYCGTKLLLDNDNEFIYKHIDEAEVKKAETEQLVKLKELEMKEKEMEQKRMLLKIKIIISLILGAIAAISFIFGDYSDEEPPILGLLCLLILMLMWMFGAILDDDKKK